MDIPYHLTSIGKATLANCTNMLGVDIKEGLLKIGAEAFRNLKSLKSVLIPEGVKMLEISLNAISKS